MSDAFNPKYVAKGKYVFIGEQMIAQCCFTAFNEENAKSIAEALNEKAGFVPEQYYINHVFREMRTYFEKLKKEHLEQAQSLSGYSFTNVFGKYQITVTINEIGLDKEGGAK